MNKRFQTDYSQLSVKSGVNGHTILHLLSFFKWVLLPVFYLMSPYATLAQGMVTVKADKNFEILLAQYKKQNEIKASIPGYRIHVMSSTSRSEINNLKAKLYTSFPDIKPYISYQAPNFKLRAGNYFYKIDAYRDLQRLLPHFPGSFIVNEELKISEL
jgi:hypothetical protein